jgi:hypothetical protein
MKKTIRNLLIVLMLFIPSLAHAQENFSVGAAMTSTFAGIGLGIDVGVGERGSSDAVRFGLWLNIPSSALQTKNFGVGFKVALISYNPFDIFAIPLGGYGDFFALYTGVYGTLGVGGNSGFFLGVGNQPDSASFWLVRRIWSGIWDSLHCRCEPDHRGKNLRREIVLNLGRGFKKNLEKPQTSTTRTLPEQVLSFLLRLER